MDMRAMERISEMLCEELEEIAQKGKMDMGDLEIAHKAIGTIKNICKIRMMDEPDDSYGDWSARGSYSRDGNSYRGGNGYRGNSYDGGNSYRGGRHWVRGHYSMDGYSRDEGINYLKEEMQKMMQNGKLTPDERMTVEKAMDMLK